MPSSLFKKLYLFPSPGYHRYTYMLEARHFGRDAEIQARTVTSRLCKCLNQATCQPVVSCSRLQGHLSRPPVCHPWTLDFVIPAEMKGLQLTRVGICNPDPNVMSTGQSPTVAQNVTDGITNPVRRSYATCRRTFVGRNRRYSAVFRRMCSHSAQYASTLLRPTCWRCWRCR